MTNAVIEEFCLNLEKAISEVFRALDEEATRGFWCDGVVTIAPDRQYDAKKVNDHRAFELKAYVGKDGQSEFSLLVHFGPKALSRYARGLGVSNCIPDTAQTEWLTTDVVSRTIEIQLY